MSDQDHPPGWTPGEHWVRDHRPEPVWVPAHYRSGPLAGPGRWCALHSPWDSPPLGVLYTDDLEVLGYLNGDGPGAVPLNHAVRQGLLEGAAQGSPVSVVFDAWAARCGQGLAAGPVQHGDLADLT